MITSEELLMKFIKGEKSAPEDVSFAEQTSAITQYCRYLKLMGREAGEIETAIDLLLTEQGGQLSENIAFYKVFFKMQYAKASALELKEIFHGDLAGVWLPHKIQLGYLYLNRILDSNKDTPKDELSHLVDSLTNWVEEREANPEYEEFR